MKIRYQGNSYNFPDFLIVGAAKSGTTSLHKYLDCHPEIFMPAKKELWFLQLRNNPNKEILSRLKYIPTSIKGYCSFFNGVDDIQTCGESTPSYLIFPDYTIESLKEICENPEKIKIIIILRKQINRMLSLYKFNLKIRTEFLNINRALDQEENRFNSNEMSIGFNYVTSSLYYNQVKKYLEFFDDVKILLYDDLKNRPKELINDVCTFLGKDSDPIIKRADLSKIYNRSNYLNKKGKINYFDVQFYRDFIKYMPNSLLRPRFFQKQIAFIKYCTTKEADINEITLKNIKNLFLEDTIKLEELTGINLQSWKFNYE